MKEYRKNSNTAKRQYGKGSGGESSRGGRGCSMRALAVLLLVVMIAPLAAQVRNNQFVAVPSGVNVGTYEFCELTVNGTDCLSLKSSDSLAAPVVWTLPGADAAGCFQSDGAGIMSIQPCGGAGTSPPFPSNTIMGRAEGDTLFHYWDVYAAGETWHATYFSQRRARGTIAAPADVVSGDLLGGTRSERYLNGTFRFNDQLMTSYDSAVGGRFQYSVGDELDVFRSILEMDRTGIYPMTAGMATGNDSYPWGTSRINTIWPSASHTGEVGNVNRPYSGMSADSIWTTYSPGAGIGYRWWMPTTTALRLDDTSQTPVIQYFANPSRYFVLKGDIFPEGASGTQSLGGPGNTWDADLQDVTIHGTCSGCGGAPANMMTTDTPQTVLVAADKLWESNIFLGGNGDILPETAHDGTVGNINLPLEGVAADAVWIAQAFGSTGAAYKWTMPTATGILLEDPGQVGVLSYVNQPNREWRFNGDINPTDFNGMSLGDASLSRRWDAALRNASVNSELTIDFSGDLIVDGVATMNGNQFTKADLSIEPTGNLLINGGNFYERTISGAPNCSGVADGWTGVDTTNKRAYWCIGGQAWFINMTQ